MIINMVGGGSGGAGFKVSTYTDVTSLPTTAKNGTLAIITDKVVSGVSIQSAVPENPADEMVYLSTIGSEAEIPITKIIQIGCTGAFMWSDGAWGAVDTYIFKEGTWKLVGSGVIYSTGNDYVDYTGGFVAHAISSRSGASATPIQASVLKDTSGNLLLDTTSSGPDGSGVSLVCTANMVDLTPYDTLVFEGEFKTNYSNYPQNFNAAAWSQIPEYYTLNRLAYFELSTSTTTKIVVDISNVNAKAYVGFGIAFSKVKLTRCYMTLKGA